MHTAALEEPRQKGETSAWGGSGEARQTSTNKAGMAAEGAQHKRAAEGFGPIPPQTWMKSAFCEAASRRIWQVLVELGPHSAKVGQGLVEFGLESALLAPKSVKHESAFGGVRAQFWSTSRRSRPKLVESEVGRDRLELGRRSSKSGRVRGKFGPNRARSDPASRARSW